ncbi:MAG: AAA family ATPase, partial [Nitrospinae bacterium]|nr:AAA family ATPase [Nitrospinota bacterium]
MAEQLVYNAKSNVYGVLYHSEGNITTMKCPNCSAEASESAKFCSECGFLLKDKQAAKIFDMSSPHAYTPHHIAEEILSNKSVMEGERKQVTVLFADVSGFTSISGRLDPEDVHKIMDGTFHILTETIHKYQGTINQFTGDGIMALFGAPLAIEGNADKACQAALEIQHLVGHYALKLSDRFGIDFKMRIGLNTGLVFVGSIGDDLRMDYTALGDTTNLASRLEGMATPGSILVSAFTYKRAKNDFIFKEAVQAKVKGKEASVDIYELLDRRKTSTKITERQVTSVLVGRDKELSILEEQVRKGIGGEGCIVNIIGEAGIGKSRLKVELTKLLIAKETKILEGRATTIDRGTSYYPLISLLRRWAEIRGDDGAETASLKLESAVRNICREETYEIFPFIATLMGMELKDEYAERVAGIVGEALENIIAKHVSELIIHISEIKPLVLIIEDLHWADESTFKLLEFLYRAATGRRIVFINLLRPAYEERDKHILRVEEESSLPVTTITLHPLDGDSSALLIDKLLHVKGLPTKLKDMIVERSGGNPFFIEEVLRSILDEGGVRVAADGQFEVTDKIDNVFIPYTINDVLMSRFDRLDDQTKEIVKVASVIGRSFFHRVLTEILEDGRDIESDLSYLKSIQILDERRRIGEVEYFFKHALAQEVAYQSIIIERRKALHLSVAKAIESIFRDRLSEFYGTL